MKTRLHTTLGQHLTLTPQLQQALRLLQLSAQELELELAQAVASNPMLEWAENNPAPAGTEANGANTPGEQTSTNGNEAADTGDSDWMPDHGPWTTGNHADSGDEQREQPALLLGGDGTALAEQLRWQLNLLHLSERDRAIGITLVDAIDSDGYLREPLDAIAQSLLPQVVAGEEEIVAVLRHIQAMEPAGIGARDLGECLALQLALLPADTPGQPLALHIARHCLERLPRAGIDGLARELRQPASAVAEAVTLLRTLDPRPGRHVGQDSHDTYIQPDVVIWRQRGRWQAALAGHAGPRVVIQRQYEQMVGHCSSADAGYLRSHLQQARWLIRGLQQRGQTLLRIARYLIEHQAAWLEFGDQALRPLTLRELAAALELHESTISRAIAGKYVRTPRGTVALRHLFSTAVDTGDGGEASSGAIQATIRQMIEAENPRKPLSDAKLADQLKQAGIAVARRTVAKYREAMNIPPSHERVRIT